VSPKPVCMRDVLSELCHRWGIERKVKEYSALSQWSQIVGEKIAEKAKPIGIERGKLFVQVDSSSWRNELTFLKREIKDKMNRAVGSPVIKDIIFSGQKGAKRAR
jgi:predicted nucleic acid-binding Zn ribbon protein